MISRTRMFCLTLALLLCSRAALAECDDPAGPGVDWSGCVKIGLSTEGADLSNANLSGLLLSSSVMTNTSFKGANLTDTRFATTDLTGSDFSGAHLLRTTFTSVRLTRTVFHNALIEVPTATNVDATDADFRGAKITDSLESMMEFCRTITPDGSVRNDACEGGQATD